MRFNHPPLSCCNLIYFKINNKISNFIGRVIFKLSRIKAGKNINFYGCPVVHLRPNADVSIGDNCKFRSGKSSNFIGVHTPCIISTLSNHSIIRIGRNCGFSGTAIGAAIKIEIGDNVKCGANTVITDTDWHHEDRRSGPDAPTIIHDNVWLGYGVVVLKGVEIGENSVIGAGSIVTRSIPSNVVAAGNPCKVIRKLNNNVT